MMKGVWMEQKSREGRVVHEGKIASESAGDGEK